MAEFKCIGDCANCRSVNDRKIQWQYCAAQFSYNAMRMMERLSEEVERIRVATDALRSEIDTINDVSVFDPTREEKAQKGSGAETIDSQESLTN